MANGSLGGSCGAANDGNDLAGASGLRPCSTRLKGSGYSCSKFVVAVSVSRLAEEVEPILIPGTVPY